ncbi:hypothetical protein NK6_8593 [Bradyrhizobium diazoefficiens]|uniref:Uncharacterized protein n=1 Tax=Bradyrhizobium diazoefficiens TaxID=1355477 RepID=A0A0E4BWB5_9BRAD|nr:hypothetical protein NK6_8593 [Bradyrhizobium diazoefficiens]
MGDAAKAAAPSADFSKVRRVGEESACFMDTL